MIVVVHRGSLKLRVSYVPFLQKNDAFFLKASKLIKMIPNGTKTLVNGK